MAASTDFGDISANTACFAKLVDRSTSVCYSARIVHSAIHAYKANRRAAILTCPTSPVAVELERSQDELYIWMALHDGQVYRKSVTVSLLENITARKLDNPDVEMIAENSNQSIFDDQLKDQQQQQQSSWPDDPVDVLPCDHVLTACGKVRNIICLKDFVVLICKGKDSMFLQWYSKSKLPLQEISSVQVVPVALPYKVGYLSHVDLHQELASVRIVTLEEDGSEISSSMLCLPLHLFSALFGMEASIKSLPVMVLGLRDGAVFSLPLDLVNLCRNEEQNKGPVSFHGEASFGYTLKLTSSWKLMCCLTSSVVDILPLKVNRKLTEKEEVAAELQKSLGLQTFTSAKPLLDAFIIISTSGQCCLLTTSPDPSSTDGKLNKIVTTFTLPSSVVCCCTDGERLFISTGQHLEWCSLMVCQEGERERVHYRVDVSSEELHTASVVHMWLSGMGEVKTLLCETFLGDKVEFPTTYSAIPGDTGRAAHTSLKDVLVNIDVNSQKMDQLKSCQQQLDHFLQQMNIASHLLHFHGPGKQGDSSQSPVLCEVTLKSEAGYHTTEHFVVVKVRNQSTVALTSDWSVVVTLNEKRTRRPHSEMSKNDPCDFPPHACPSSVSVSLSHGLVPNQDVCVKLPVFYSSSSVGMDISVNLVLQHPQWLREKEQVSNSSGVLGRQASENIQGSAVDAVSGCRPLISETTDVCLFIPVHCTVISVLHFLQVRQPGSKFAATPAVNRHSEFGTMVAQLKQLQSEAVLERAFTTQPSQSFSITLDIPESFNSHHNLTAPADNLRTILADSQSDVPSITQSSCTVQDPFGSLLSVSVEKSSHAATDMNGTRPKDSSFRVVLKSSDVSLLARARLALLSKFQMCHGEQKALTVGGLQKVISATEDCQQQLQDVQEKMRRKDEDTLLTLGALYENMRNLPL